jgi:Glutamyl-tRNAGlu reductase, N-terminal domain
VNPKEKVYLCSLRWTTDDQISKPCRDVWRWKDAILGDGRDFFVPKPKTIGALQDLLKEHCALTQVSVLSNCARLEIICVCASDPIPNICRCLVAQLHPNDSGNIFRILTQSMDVPDWVLRSDPLSSGRTPQSKELEHHWDVKEGYEDIVQHLCLVAAGLASRPRRPDREVIFRPFSSRDAHILLQLKRTKEVAQGKDTNKLLECALRAGKAARNPTVVPALSLLREYGSGDSKYSTEAPRETLQQVISAVMAMAIKPLVDEFVESASMTEDIASAIALLRRVENLALTPEERSWIRKRLHQPTVALRDGSLDASEVVHETRRIKAELNCIRIGEAVT